jgi:hypothetical protein
VPQPQFDAEHINKLQEFECLIVQHNTIAPIMQVCLSGQKHIISQTLHELKKDYLGQMIMSSSLAKSEAFLRTIATQTQKN